VVEAVCVEVGSSSSASEARSFSRGRISAVSPAGGVRRGRVLRARVVARRRCEQNRQCWVWIGSFVGGAGVVDILGG
jgi:hypothetical protein